MVSTRLNVSLSTVKRWRYKGTGPKYAKIGDIVRYCPGKCRRLPRGEITQAKEGGVIMAHDRDGLFRKRKSPFWYFKAPRLGAPGKYDDVTTRETMKSKAFLVKAEHLKKLRDGLLPNERATWTLSQALGQELEFRALSRRATSEAPNRTAGKHLLRLIGANKRLKQIAAIAVIENFQMQRLKEGRKPKTVNNEVYLLSAILTKAGLWDQVERHSSHCRLRRRTAVRH